MQEQCDLTLPASSSSSDKHNQLKERFKPKQQLPPLELKRLTLPNQKMKKAARLRGRGRVFQWFGNAWRCFITVFILMSRFTVNSRGLWDRGLERIFQVRATPFIFTEIVWVTPWKMAAWEAACELLFCCTRKALQELQLHAKGDPPKDKRNSEEPGRHHMPGTSKTWPEFNQGLCQHCHFGNPVSGQT